MQFCLLECGDLERQKRHLVMGRTTVVCLCVSVCVYVVHCAEQFNCALAG